MNRKFLTVLETGKSKIKVGKTWSSENLLPRWLYSHKAEAGKRALWSLIYKETNRTHEGFTLIT